MTQVLCGGDVKYEPKKQSCKVQSIRMTINSCLWVWFPML
nr:MAG TPA_asm: hypothetical protein [Caudoviricetes sp.]